MGRRYEARKKPHMEYAGAYRVNIGYSHVASAQKRAHQLHMKMEYAYLNILLLSKNIIIKKRQNVINREIILLLKTVFTNIISIFRHCKLMYHMS